MTTFCSLVRCCCCPPCSCLFAISKSSGIRKKKIHKRHSVPLLNCRVSVPLLPTFPLIVEASPCSPNRRFVPNLWIIIPLNNCTWSARWNIFLVCWIYVCSFFCVWSQVETDQFLCTGQDKLKILSVRQDGWHTHLNLLLFFFPSI